MNAELTSLVKLQEQDLVAEALRKECARLQAEAALGEERLKALSAEVAAFKEQFTRLQLKKKELEIDIDAKEQQMKKFQGELNSVKTNEAYKALLKEIEASKSSKSSLEDELLNVLQSIEDGQRQIREREHLQKGEEAVIRVDIQKAQAKLSEAEAALQARASERDGFAATLPADLRGRYDSIRKSKGGLAVVPLRGDACGGCRQRLTLHAVNDVAKDKGIVACEACGRILFPEAAPSANPAPS